MIVAVAAIALCTTIGIIARPWRTPDYLWPLLGAIACLLVRGIDLSGAWHAVIHGLDVYAFLIGILAISAFASREHVFDALAQALLERCGASQTRIFLAIFAIAALITIVFSNDATIVVATPAALAVLARINAQRMPYLLACAFVANAASFVLPISNPANLVLFGGSLPAALPWALRFGVPSLLALVVTYATLVMLCRRSLREPIELRDASPIATTPRLRRAIAAICVYGVGLVVATALGLNVGYSALALAALCIGGCAIWHHDVVLPTARRISWSIVPLVGGLFVIVAALDHTGALDILRNIALSMHGRIGVLETAGGVTALVNAFNNLPVGVALGTTLASVHDAHILTAATIAVDLGPNLSVSGSLATLLWLTLLRQNGIHPSPMRFLAYGAVVTATSLAAAILPLLF